MGSNIHYCLLKNLFIKNYKKPNRKYLKIKNKNCNSLEKALLQLWTVSSGESVSIYNNYSLQTLILLKMRTAV